MDVTGCGNRSRPAADNRKRRIGLLGNYGIPGGYLECQATPVTQTWHRRVSRSHVSNVEGEEGRERLSVNETEAAEVEQPPLRSWTVEEWSHERTNSNVNRTLVRFAAQRRSHRRRTMADRTFRLIPDSGVPDLPRPIHILDRWGVAAFSPPRRSPFHGWISILSLSDTFRAPFTSIDFSDRESNYARTFFPSRGYHEHDAILCCGRRVLGDSR